MGGLLKRDPPPPPQKKTGGPARRASKAPGRKLKRVQPGPRVYTTQTVVVPRYECFQPRFHRSTVARKLFSRGSVFRHHPRGGAPVHLVQERGGGVCNTPRQMQMHLRINSLHFPPKGYVGFGKDVREEVIPNSSGQTVYSISVQSVRYCIGAMTY